MNVLLPLLLMLVLLLTLLLLLPMLLLTDAAAAAAAVSQFLGGAKAPNVVLLVLNYRRVYSMPRLACMSISHTSATVSFSFHC